MRVLILGAGGQLGQELNSSVPDGVEISSFSSQDLDITDRELLEKTINNLRPQIVINAAAYTKVDLAESNAEKAFLVNADSVKWLASSCSSVGAGLIHISTDFVFDGCASQALTPDDIPNPINVYGKSKLLGEQGIISSGIDNYVIIRTSWVYSRFGANFVKTMLKLMQEKERLAVVGDQIGCPTSAYKFGKIIWELVQKWFVGQGFDSEISGKIYHWSDSGVASWYDFAYEIQQQGLNFGLLSNRIPLAAISTDDYPTAAKRPKFSLLDSREICKDVGVVSSHWRDELSVVLQQLAS